MKKSGLPIALRIALLYALFGSGWILFSDRLLIAMTSDVATLTRLQTVKGWAFVAVSALLIFFLLRRELQRRNITEKRIAESEERYRLISAVASDYTYSARLADGKLVLNWVAGAFEDITGYTLDEYVAHGGWRAAVHPDDLAQDDRDMGNLRAGQHVVTEIRTLTKSGQIRWVRVYAHPVLDGQSGELASIYGAVQDITARKHAEEGLRRRADEFEALYDTARDLSTQRDFTVLLETIARQTARLLGASDATIYLYDAGRGELEVAAANIYSVPRGTRLPVDGGVSSEVIRTRQPKIVDNYRTWGQPRPELQHLDLRAVAIVPLVYREEIIGALGVAEVGTERKYTAADVRLLELIAAEAAIAIQNTRLHAELEASNKELEQRVTERTRELGIAKDRAESADRVKSAFLATMSHELRTPLNSIIGFTGVLLQGLAGPLNAEQSKQMGMARDSARHLLALINDVLDISKIEAGQLEIRRAPFDMRSAIENAMKLVLPQAQKKGLSLAAVIGANVGEIVSDERRVEQILINLLNNAVKFTERGEVNLECRVRDGFVETSVRDTGIGIRVEDVEKLFAPFRQIETGLNRRHEGTGLGLSICKNLVEMLGGEIRVESEWGRGSVFTFTLPLT